MRKQLIIATLALSPLAAEASAVFDGANDSLVASGASCLSSPNWTGAMGVWAKQINAFGSDLILGQYNSSAATNFVTLRAGSTGTFDMQVGDGSNTASRGLGSVSVDEWTLLVLERTATNAQRHFRGVPGGVASWSTVNTTTVAPSGLDHVRLGESPTGTLDWEGKAAYVWCATSVTESEVAQMLAGYAPDVVLGAKLVSYWKLTEDFTASVGGVNFSANGNVYIDTMDNPPVIESLPPDFEGALTLDSVTHDEITLSFEATNAGDDIFVAVFPAGTTAPSSCSAIASPTGASGAETDTTTGDEQQIVVEITDSPVHRYYDAYACISDGVNDSPIESVTDIEMDPPPGYQFVDLTSVGSGTPFEEFNATVDPDIGNGDYVLAPTTTTPGGYPFYIDSDGHFWYAPPVQDDSRQNVTVRPFDVSARAYHSHQLVWWANNQAPACSDTVTIIMQTGSSVTLDLANESGALCTDDENDELTCSASTTLPAGVTLNNCKLTLAPTTPDLVGTLLEFEVSDPPGDIDTQKIALFVLGPVSAPDCTGLGELACVDLWDDALLGTASFEVDYEENIAPAGTVISQTPSAGSPVGPYPIVQLVVSLGIEGITVPNVIGEEDVEDATAVIEGAGFILGGTTVRCSSEPAGEIVGQSPPPGALAEPGSEIDLLVSSGMACMRTGRPGVRLPGFRFPGL